MLQLQDDEMEALQAALSFVDDLPPTELQENTSIPPSSDLNIEDQDLDTELNRLLLETLSSDQDDEVNPPQPHVLPTPLLPMVASLDVTSISTPNSRPKTSGQKTKRRAQANPNRARDERKHELAYLRHKVEQLEEELETLQQRRIDTQQEQSCATGKAKTGALVSTESGASTAMESLVWKAIATRQEKRRETSERENARLKLVLESQVKLARSMETLFAKRARQQVAGCAGVVGRSDGFSSQGSTLDLLANKHTFDELLMSVDQAYSEMNGVFATNGLLGSEIPVRDGRMREGPNGMYLDVFATKLLPFGYDAVAAAVWSHFRGNAKHNGVVYENATQHLGASADTIMEVFTMELVGKDMNADFRVKQVVRRYIEADQQVVILVCRGYGLDNADSPFSGCGFFEKAYVVTKRPTSISQNFTIVQMCSILSPRMATDCSMDLEEADKFVDFVLSVVATNTTFNQELIENVLLEQELKNRQSSVQTIN